jgi:hypothetical protein
MNPALFIPDQRKLDVELLPREFFFDRAITAFVYLMIFSEIKY